MGVPGYQELVSTEIWDSEGWWIFSSPVPAMVTQFQCKKHTSGCKIPDFPAPWCLRLVHGHMQAVLETGLASRSVSPLPSSSAIYQSVSFSSAFANSECSQFKNPCMVLSGISLMHTYVEAEGPEALQTGKQFGRPMMSATLWM